MSLTTVRKAAYLSSMKTIKDICEMLNDGVKAAGSQAAWADKANVSRAYVCDILNGRRDPGISISRMFGYEPVVMYRRIKKCK